MVGLMLWVESTASMSLLWVLAVVVDFRYGSGSWWWWGWVIDGGG